MSKSKHTRGPWKIVAPKGRNNQAHWIGLASDEFHSIAEVRNGADDDEYGGEETELANANLIAAAPNLLKRLEEMNGMWRAAAVVGSITDDAWAKINLACNRADTAIAEAKGKGP